jgi:very-short-patch-repair endonuclease
MREREDAWIWELAERQHGVVSRRQLLEQDLSPDAIRHRIAVGRLFPVHDGVYAVGRPQLDRLGAWSAAVLRCGPEAVLSHRTAAALWQIADEPVGGLEVSVPGRLERVGPGIRAHRRGAFLAKSVTRHRGIPVTTVPQTLLDLARHVSRGRLEAAINAADRLGLADPEALRREVDAMRGRPGVVSLRRVLDRHDFVLTDSELERRFLPIARSAGLSTPATGVRLNGFKVDFFWPDLGLVIETDGLRYHRTAAAQSRDRVRDQAHTASGLTQLRFTHFQVKYQASYVQTRLVQTVQHLRRRLQAAG